MIPWPNKARNRHRARNNTLICKLGACERNNCKLSCNWIRGRRGRSNCTCNNIHRNRNCNACMAPLLSTAPWAKRSCRPARNCCKRGVQLTQQTVKAPLLLSGLCECQSDN